METVIEPKKIVQRSFIICKRGNAFIPIRTEDVLLIMHHSGINFAIDKANNKYVVDKTLSQFEDILDEAMFFRVNRQAIVNIQFIKEFKSLDYGKILIELKDSSWIKKDLVVSQGNAPRFRSWIDNL
ncbi:MAG: LytR/AlgR family response regulator transcription factor [Flavisolibacter sp.]